MTVSLIAAVAENGVIGRDGRVPWHLPDDLKHFKRLTTGRLVIMGRKTWDELGKPLAKRRNVVITRDPSFRAEGAETLHDLDAALALAGPDEEVFVIGGAEIYRMALPGADRLYFTVVHTNVEGDTFFPSFDPSDWVLVDEVVHTADDRHAHPYTFRRYERRRAS